MEHEKPDIRPLILIGGGGHCKSVIDAALSAGFTVRGVLDTASHVGLEVLGYPIVGTDEDIPRYAKECDFVVAIGAVKNCHTRVRLYESVLAAGGRLATIIASTARVSPYASVGTGTVVLHGACINAGARVGRNCIVNTMANVEHDVVVGDHVHISTGAMVNGECVIENQVFIGSNATLCNGVSIAAGAVVGAGAVVCRNIDRPGVYVGAPAKIID